MKRKTDEEQQVTNILQSVADPLLGILNKKYGPGTHRRLAMTCMFFYQHEKIKDFISEIKKSRLFASKCYTFILCNNRLFFKGYFNLMSVPCKRFEEVNTEKFQGSAIIKLATGDDFVLVLLANGRLFARGSNEYCQSGLGEKKFQDDFEEISAPEGSKILDVFAGGKNSFIKTDTDKIFARGLNGNGELGLDSKQAITSFQEVLVPKTNEIIQILSFSARSFILNKKGELWASMINYHHNNAYGFEKLELKLPSETKIIKIFGGESRLILQLSCGTLVSVDSTVSYGTAIECKGFFSLPESTTLEDIILRPLFTLVLLDTGQIWMVKEPSDACELTPKFSEGVKVVQFVQEEEAIYLLLNNYEIWDAGLADFPYRAGRDFHLASIDDLLENNPVGDTKNQVLWF